MHDSREPHLNLIKRVLRYLKGTVDLSLQLHLTASDKLVAYSDADWAGCPNTCDRPQVIISFLVTVLFVGPPSVRLQFLDLVLKRSTWLLQMLWLNPVGSANY